MSLSAFAVLTAELRTYKNKAILQEESKPSLHIESAYAFVMYVAPPKLWEV